ncbi:CgeB family protein [Cerasicoccus arenae]|uniref:Spore protein YkvP/CgeB glycosyl transferase-like domain-containing protein n=1 Tax=Cerasicoccus arenae TaxID=424488 RepID=A0A8J3GCU1_9BACT|nr:glycosyltransferase [Cerasicoccus arenae]MBK1857039.1 glycosyltransferase [Cerasicoccus arenae]GHB92010.1 hypothetical protein GCM10007047_03730 [Cerasicoccus arenae]
MKATYIGILTPGTTSRMRADVLRSLTPGWEWSWIDTHPPYLTAPRWAKTLSFRAKLGPVISQTNKLVKQKLTEKQDLIWVDKAAYLSFNTTKIMRQHAETLIHYTPDTAYHTNRSQAFNRSLQFYDWAISTKSFEANEYLKWLPADRLIMTTQGYDNTLHSPRTPASEKRLEAVFVGLCEPDRETCVEELLKAGIPVRIAGFGWDGFQQRHPNNPDFHYIGNAVFGEDYAQLLSQSWISLGLVSKRFPELHTTRTFEIPACGTILATEKNSETQSFFSDQEALFFQDYNELAGLLKALLQDSSRMEKMAAAGEARVKRDQRDYRSILQSLLEQTGVLATN